MLASPSIARDLYTVRLGPSLEPTLCCPRCKKRPFATFQRPRIDVIHVCQYSLQRDGRHQSHCRQHWWAMLLEEAPVEPQLAWAFEDAGLAALLMDLYRLPVELPAPMYWQLPLTGNQVHRHRRADPRALFQALGLTKGIV